MLNKELIIAPIKKKPTRRRTVQARPIVDTDNTRRRVTKITPNVLKEMTIKELNNVSLKQEYERLQYEMKIKVLNMFRLEILKLEAGEQMDFVRLSDLRNLNSILKGQGNPMSSNNGS